jgi:hypothetical protein
VPDANANGHSHVHTYAHCDSDFHTSSICNGYIYANAYSYRDCYRDADRDGNSHAHAHGHADVHSNAKCHHADCHRLKNQRPCRSESLLDRGDIE